jgi:hypothetical protein
MWQFRKAYEKDFNAAGIKRPKTIDELAELLVPKASFDEINRMETCEVQQ